MEFIFKAKDPSGAIREGKVDAISRDSAVELLQKNGLVPLQVDRKSSTDGFRKELQRLTESVTPKELTIFYQELATLVEAKVPFVASLGAIEAQLDNKYFRTVIREIKGDVEDGMPLSDGMMRHPDVFDALAVSMVRSGEISGNLQKSITFLAENTEKNYRLTSQVKGALYYPTFVIATALIIGFIAVTMILPKLTSVIREMNIVVPWYTKVIMSTGDFMQTYWWAVLVIVVGTLGGFVYYIKTEAGKREWDHVVLRMPVVGNLLKALYMSRFAENFAVLMTGGIPIVKSLTIVSDIMGNSVYQSIVLRAADEVKAGGNISTVFERSAAIPPIVTRMVRVGEETGKMSEILEKVAKFYDEEAQRTTANLTSLIEPILIVALGLGVAVMAFGILLPIYDIAGKIQ
ncbi:type II secretion system F family protein [Patescibacteria group bacterium]|nr:MAG: type II secretion system F family protein [Patescibacteria group bacterium]